MWGSYPVGKVYLPLLSDKLQHPRMRHLLLPPVYKLEHHRVRDVQSSEFIEGRRWHQDFPAVVHSFSLRAGQHDDGVAPVVFVEAGGSAAGHAPEHGGWVHPEHGVIVVEEGGSVLQLFRK